MQSRRESDTLAILKYFEKKEAFENVYKTLKDYQSEAIDSWDSYLNYTYLGIFLSQICMLVGCIMIPININAFERSEEPTLPAGLTIFISAAALLLTVMFMKGMEHARSNADRVKLLNKEEKGNLNQLVSSLGMKASKKVTDTLWSLTNIKDEVEYRKKARLSFLSFREHPDSTIPANIPNEIVHKIFNFSGLFSKPVEEKTHKEIEAEAKSWSFEF